jgi:hypothetical protein
VTGYADPETLIADWLHVQTDYKMWADPRLPADWPFNAPIGHVQRGTDAGDVALSLDVALLDIDFYAKRADTAREAAAAVRDLMLLTLPLYTFPTGVFVKAVTGGIPIWAPDPSLHRRSATYRVTLHGLIA